MDGLARQAEACTGNSGTYALRLGIGSTADTMYDESGKEDQLFRGYRVPQ